MERGEKMMPQIKRERVQETLFEDGTKRVGPLHAALEMKEFSIREDLGGFDLCKVLVLVLEFKGCHALLRPFLLALVSVSQSGISSGGKRRRQTLCEDEGGGEGEGFCVLPDCD